MAIDTLAYVKELEAAGLDRKLAEAHAAALRDKILPELATKHDLRKELWRVAAGIGVGAVAVAVVVGLAA
jgi:hypothetical protein